MDTANQFQVVVLIIMTLLTIIGTLTVRLLNRIDKSLSVLNEATYDMNARISIIEAMHCQSAPVYHHRRKSDVKSQTTKELEHGN